VRASRIVPVALLAGSLLATPAVSGATNYSHFSSSTCNYHMDYPSGWRVDHTPLGDLFAHSVSARRFAGVWVICTPPSSRASLTLITSGEVNSFKQRGWAPSMPKFSHGFGVFTGHRHVQAGTTAYTQLYEVITTVKKPRMYVVMYSGDSASFITSLFDYLHMVSTFRGT